MFYLISSNVDFITSVLSLFKIVLVQNLKFKVIPKHFHPFTWVLQIHHIVHIAEVKKEHEKEHEKLEKKTKQKKPTKQTEVWYCQWNPEYWLLGNAMTSLYYHGN